jgi:DNA-binding LytR/AlgR family response regulator
MKLLIVEDEMPAYETLVRSIRNLDIRVDVAGWARSVREAINMLRIEKPELIFMDVQLSDGLSFNIFKHVNVNCPVIFTTAYDEYVTQSLQYNGIDYLLKPVESKKLEAAIMKYEKLKLHFSQSQVIEKDGHPEKPVIPKERLLLKKGNDYVAVKSSDIAYFYTQHKISFAVCENGDKLVVNKKMLEIENDLDMSVFFRSNRQFIINKNFVKKFRMCDKSKIFLELTVPVREEIIISQENASDFKAWLQTK